MPAESVKAAHERLPEDAQRLYQLIAMVHPGPDITAPAAAALAGRHVDDAERALAALSADRLTTVEGPVAGMSRYTLTDQARDHAAALGPVDSEEIGAALRRLVDWYLGAATSVAKILNPGRWYVGDGYDQPPAIAFPSERAALDWAAVEHRNLEAVLRVAFDTGLYAKVWQTVEGLWAYWTRLRLADACISFHTLGLKAAVAEGNTAAQARMLMGRGWGYNAKQNPHDAIQDALQARELEEANGHRVGVGSSIEIIGHADMTLGRPDKAAAHFLTAREIFLDEDRPRGAALMTRFLGRANYEAGRYHEAAGQFRQSFVYFNSVERERYHQARILNHLAPALMKVGSPDEAVDVAEHALAIAEDIDSPLEMATAHVQLADLAAGAEAEQHHLDEARKLVDGLVGVEADRIRERVGAMATGR